MQQPQCWMAGFNSHNLHLKINKETEKKLFYLNVI